jgi:hypothetical protein
VPNIEPYSHVLCDKRAGDKTLLRISRKRGLVKVALGLV